MPDSKKEYCSEGISLKKSRFLKARKVSRTAGLGEPAMRLRSLESGLGGEREVQRRDHFALLCMASVDGQ